MKRLKKGIIISLILCILVSLSGCVDVQELRDAHAYYTDDTMETVHFRGNDYTIFWKNIDFELPLSGTGYLTAKDVPLLLASVKGVTMEFNDSCTVIYCSSAFADTYFVRNDFTDTFTSLIENPEFDDFCYYSYDNDYNRSVKVIDEKFDEIFEKSLESAPIPGTDIFITAVENEIYRCDSTVTLLDKAFDICSADDGYYFDTGYSLHKVPSEYNEMIEEILSPFEYGDYYEYYDEAYDYEEDFDLYI